MPFNGCFIIQISSQAELRLPPEASFFITICITSMRLNHSNLQCHLTVVLFFRFPHKQNCVYHLKRYSSLKILCITSLRQNHSNLQCHLTVVLLFRFPHKQNCVYHLKRKHKIMCDTVDQYVSSGTGCLRNYRKYIL